MKKLTATLAAFALAATANIAAPAAAQSNSNNTTVQQCSLLVGYGFFATHGDCMGTIRSSAPSLCRQLKAVDALDFFGWSNVGQCVSALRGN